MSLFARKICRNDFYDFFGYTNFMKLDRFIINQRTALCALLAFSGAFCGFLQSSINLPAAAFFVFVPMLYALTEACSAKNFLVRYACFFLPYYLIQLSFLLTVWKLEPLPKWAAVPLAVLACLALTLWESGLMLAAVCLFIPFRRRIDDGILRTFILSFLICTGEWLQEAVPFLAFPWSGVWLTVTDSPLLLRSAAAGNCRLTSFIILAANGLLAQCIFSRKKIPALLALAALQISNISCCAYSLKKTESLISTDGESLTVMCAQDSVQGEEKSKRKAFDSAVSYLNILNDGWKWGTDLVLLPETAVPADFDDELTEFRLLSDFARSKGCTVVTGSFFLDGGKDYNALLAFTPDGEVTAPYLKQVLVPFGEKIPLASLWGAHTMCECNDPAYTKPLETGENTVGAVICVESVFSDLVKAQTRQGAQFLCVSTNDSWFGKSSAREQHYRHCIMRAVENNCYLLRAGNCGISAVISPTGEQLSAKTDSCKGVVCGEIKLSE